MSRNINAIAPRFESRHDPPRPNIKQECALLARLLWLEIIPATITTLKIEWDTPTGFYGELFTRYSKGCEKCQSISALGDIRGVLRFMRGSLACGAKTDRSWTGGFFPPSLSQASVRQARRRQVCPGFLTISSSRSRTAIFAALREAVRREKQSGPASSFDSRSKRTRPPSCEVGYHS